MNQDWPIDLKSLRYFVGVAEEKSFSRAASRLRIAQPAISRQVRSLEDDLGVELFTRHARGVDLTEAGEILLRRAYTIFRQVQQARDDVNTHSRTPRGTVTVGAPPTAGEFIIPRLIAQSRAAYPEVELRFVEGFSGELHQKLMNNEISLAVMHNPTLHPEIKISELLTEYLCVVGPAGSLTRTGYTLAEVAAMPLVLPDRPNHLRILIDEHAERHDLTVDASIHSDGVWLTKAIVREGHGFTILTAGAVISEVRQGLLDAVPISDPSIPWRLGVAMRVDQSRKRTFVVIEELIHAIAGGLVAENIWR